MNAAAPSISGRLMSLDAYRGFIMLAMVSGGFGASELLNVKKWPGLHQTEDWAKWKWLLVQLDHVKWAGCVFWDLIQPAFMFMVGASMPFAFAKRVERGENWWHQLGHVIKRCALLCLIGFVLDSFTRERPYIQFIRVLQQIAIGYFIAFLVLHLGPLGQGGAIVLLLGLHTYAFYHVGGDQAWNFENLENNFGRQLDRGIHEPFERMGYPDILPLSRTNYVSFNAISSAATILFGVLAGGLLRTTLASAMKAFLLAAGGTGLYFAGLALEPTVPMVKRLWTASFALYAAGWTCWMMAFFYVVVDIIGWRGWAFPFVVVGVNSIFIYVCAGLLKNTVGNLMKPLTFYPLRNAGPWEPVVQSVLLVLVLWLFCLFLYRQRIFFKV